MPKYINQTNEVILQKGEYLRIDSRYYKYIGNVHTIKEIPESDCLYTIDGLLYIRKVNYDRLQKLKAKVEPVKEIDDSDELDLEVKPGDDSTLIIVKELLKGFTKNSFRKLFDNDSDMNNVRRAIEKSPNGQLSLNRFRSILEKLGLKYKIIVYEDENSNVNKDMLKRIDDINNDRIEKPEENGDETQGENEE